MKLEIDKRFLRGLLYYNLLLLNILNAAVLVTRYFVGEDGYLFLGFFNLNAENNLPTFYSTMLFLCSSALSLLIGRCTMRTNKEKAVYWFILGITMIYLALDEFAQLHEPLSKIINLKFGTNGFLMYSWVIPFGLLALVFGVVYVFRFLPGLPPFVRKQMLLAGIIYLSGAIGFEMIGAKVASMGGGKVLYALMYTCEESFELAGMSLFLYALTVYLHDVLKLKIKFK